MKKWQKIEKFEISKKKKKFSKISKKFKNVQLFIQKGRII